jgi:hypothetical protein
MYNKDKVGVTLMEIGYVQNRDEFTSRPIPNVFTKRYRFMNQLGAEYYVQIAFDMRKDDNPRMWIYDDNANTYLKEFPELRYIKELRIVSDVVMKEGVVVTNGITDE